MKELPIEKLNRLALNLSRGEEVREFLRSPLALEGMINASERKQPAVSGVSTLLLERFPKEMRNSGHRQFVGAAIKLEMERNGFVHVGRKDCRHDPVFKSGGLYRRPAEPSAAIFNEETLNIPFEFVEAYIAGMKSSDARRISTLIMERLSAK